VPLDLEDASSHFSFSNFDLTFVLTTMTDDGHRPSSERVSSLLVSGKGRDGNVLLREMCSGGDDQVLRESPHYWSLAEDEMGMYCSERCAQEELKVSQLRMF
jgi:hypothetical protein